MKRSTDRIITTHAGSLVRPSEIITIMRQIENGKPFNNEELTALLTPSVREVVHEQAEAGVDIPSDGEFGKRGWTQYVGERLGGLEFRSAGDAPSVRAAAGARGGDQFQGFYEVYDRIERTVWLPHAEGEDELPAARAGAWVCVGPVTYKGAAAIKRDIANFQAALKGVQVEEAFMPVVAPCSVESGRRNEYYKSDEEYLFAIAEALKVEYHAIIDAGFVLQVDDALLPMHWARMPDGSSKEDYRQYVELRIKALNYALEGIPEERIRYHICWGSQNVPHTWDVPLADIVDLLLTIKAQAYSIESANPQHEHEWQVWEDVKLPDGKILIPGVISHATNIVENPDLVAWRIENFARLIGRENVIPGTDCGFSQNWNLVRVHQEVQWAKLEALAEGARRASEHLWGN
jgi:5-methyltetrahydropteroyltriglutamate--homocysteine methyltransferase